MLGGGGSVTIVFLPVWLGLRPPYGGNRVVMPVHRYRMFSLYGRSRDVFAALDVGAGASHEGSLQSSLGRSHERTYLS